MTCHLRADSGQIRTLKSWPLVRLCPGHPRRPCMPSQARRAARDKRGHDAESVIRPDRNAVQVTGVAACHRGGRCLITLRPCFPITSAREPCHAAQHRPYPHQPCRQPDPAAGADRVSACPARAAPGRRGGLRGVPNPIGRGYRAPAGRGRHRRGRRRRIRQDHQLVAICAGAAVGLRAPPDQSRRQSVRARRRPHPLRGILRRTRRPRRPGHPVGSRLHRRRSPIPDRRSCSATSTISRRRWRRSASTEAFLPVAAPASVIPDRKNEYYPSEDACLQAIAEAMRTEYRMIVDAGFVVQLDDARTAVTYDRMVPPASFADYRHWVATLCRGGQPCARRHPGGPRALSRLLGQLAGPAHHRRAAAGHRRSHPESAGRGLRDRGRQSAPRARMEGVGGREAAPRQGADPRRHQPRHQHRRASRAGVRAHRAVARLVGRENVIAGTDCGFAQSPMYRRVHPSIMWAKLEALSEGARLATKELWGK